MRRPAQEAQKKVASRWGLTWVPWAGEKTQVDEGSALAALAAPMKTPPWVPPLEVGVAGAMAQRGHRR